LPLFADGLKKIHSNLLQVQSGKRPKLARVGTFTEGQLIEINATRASMKFEPLHSLFLFSGKHLYKSRCVDNGYSIEEILVQVESALSGLSIVRMSGPSAVLRNPEKRADLHGNLVHDEAVFECTAQFPYAELFSVIPKGDKRTKSKT
jgi:hypothetical protein